MLFSLNFLKGFEINPDTKILLSCLQTKICFFYLILNQTCFKCLNSVLYIFVYSLVCKFMVVFTCCIWPNTFFRQSNTPFPSSEYS